MNDIETHVLELIGENVDSPDVFTDDDSGLAQIRDSINDAIEEISIVTGGNKDRYYLPIRQGQFFYRMWFERNSVAWITDVWLMSQKRRLEQTDIVRLNHHNPRWLFNSGTPWSYFPVGFYHIGIWPAPSSDDDLLDITAVVVPNRYTRSGARIKLRNDFKWAAAHFAVGEFWASRGDAKTAMYHHGEYLKKLGVDATYPESNEAVRHYQTDKQPWPVNTP